MGKGGGGTTTTTQNTAPWSEQQPYLTFGFDQAQSNYLNNPAQFYPGATYVPMSGQTSQGLDMLGRAAEQGAPTTDATLGMLRGTAGGNYLATNPANPFYSAFASGQPTNAGTTALTRSALGMDLYGNPYLDATMDAASRGITRNFQTAVAPGVDTSFVTGGRYGSGAWGNAVDGANTALAQTLADTASKVYGQNYQTERGLQLNSAGLLSDLAFKGAEGLQSAYSDERTNQLRGAALVPALEQSRFLPGQVMLDVGAAREGYDQAALSDAIQRWNFAQQSPYNNLAQYMGLVQGNYGGSGTVTQPYYQNRGAGALGGALSGASMGSMIMPGWGTAIGAGVGLLGGLFS